MVTGRTDIPEIVVAYFFFVRQHCYFRRELPLAPQKGEHTSAFGAGCNGGKSWSCLKEDSQFWWFDFKLDGERYRGSTKETSTKRA